MLNCLLRHGDRVTVGCQAQLITMLGLIRSEEVARPGSRPSLIRSIICGAWPEGTSCGTSPPEATMRPLASVVSPVVDAQPGKLSRPHRRRSSSPTAAKPSPAQFQVNCRRLPVDRLSPAPAMAGADRSAPIAARLLTAATFDQQTLPANLLPLSWTVLDLD
ncbi:hypothetical protein [Microlunatus aurantiacus]|uniref:hypothetical protein n=1 Tax=Microlunatus aurantiacus TaxID=446786 RepID=UPI003CD0BD41